MGTNFCSMTTKVKHLLDSMAMGLALIGQSHGIPKHSGKVVPFRKDPIIPKGCYWYHFDFDGRIISYGNVNLKAGFWQCIALNGKAAKRKFDNYKQSLNNKRG